MMGAPSSNALERAGLVSRASRDPLWLSATALGVAGIDMVITTDLSAC